MDNSKGPKNEAATFWCHQGPCIRVVNGVATGAGRKAYSNVTSAEGPHHGRRSRSSQGVQPLFRRVYASKHLFHVSRPSPTNPRLQDNSRTSHGYHCRARLVQPYRLFAEAQQTCSRSMWIPSHSSKALMRLSPLCLLSLAIWGVGDQRSRILKPPDRPVFDQIFSFLLQNHTTIFPSASSTHYHLTTSILTSSTTHEHHPVAGRLSSRHTHTTCST